MAQDVTSILKTIIGEETINGISKTSGTTVPQTKTAVKTALPGLIEALAKNSGSKDGAQSLSDALDDHDGSILDDLLGAIGKSDTQTDGAKILEHIYSDKGAGMVKNIASKAGISSDKASGILQTVAPLVMEALGKTKQEKGLDASGISGILSGLISNKSGGSLLVNLLDQNKDGNYKDDLLTMLINWIKKMVAGK